MRVDLYKNVLANYGGNAVNVAAPMLALPFYLHALGGTQWGLMGFVATLIGMLGLLDHGIHQALLREFALRTPRNPEQAGEYAALLGAMERVYLFAAMIAAALILFFSNTIANYWLIRGTLDPVLCHQTIMAAGLLVAAQIPGMLYGTALLACGRQISYNAISAPATLLRHAGGCVLVAIVPSILALLAWQIIVYTGETILRGYFSWQIAARTSTVFRSRATHPNLPAGMVPRLMAMSSTVLLGALSSQIDRIILSTLVPVAELGHYVVAASISGALLQFIYPITTAVLPTMIALQGDHARLKKLHGRLFLLFLVMISCAALVVTFWGKPLLYFWLHDHAYADQVWTPLIFLLLGTAINALYNIGYTQWLTQNSTRPILIANVTAVVFAVVAVPIAIHRYGIAGAAASWIGTNVIGLVLSVASLVLLYRPLPTPLPGVK